MLPPHLEQALFGQSLLAWAQRDPLSQDYQAHPLGEKTKENRVTKVWVYNMYSTNERGKNPSMKLKETLLVLKKR